MNIDEMYFLICSIIISFKAVVLNSVGGTEPHKFHTCIHGTLRSWNFYFFFKFKTYVYNYIPY